MTGLFDPALHEMMLQHLLINAASPKVSPRGIHRQFLAPVAIICDSVIFGLPIRSVKAVPLFYLYVLTLLALATTKTLLLLK